MDIQVARQLWDRLNDYHSIVYFGPEPKEEYDALGLRGWAPYFASRSAPLGQLPPDVVTAVFYGFHPKLARRALADVWSHCSPEDVTAARLRGADRALTRRLNGRVDNAELAIATDLIRDAVEHCEPNGRPVFAGHAALDWPAPAHLRLWHAATLYREYRGDAHVAVLVSEGIGPCHSLVLQAAVADAPADVAGFLKTMRGWSETEWDAAHQELQRDGLVDEHGVATSDGRTLRETMESRTDQRSIQPWRALGEDKLQVLLGALDTVRALGHT